MRPQFPGMDPWLEQPNLWPDVHSSLITAIRDTLSPVLTPPLFRGCGTANNGRYRAGYRPDLSTGCDRSFD